MDVFLQGIAAKEFPGMECTRLQILKLRISAKDFIAAVLLCTA